MNEKYLLDRNDMLANQWALYRCGIQQSWEWLQENGKHPGGDASIVVAVIDTGVDFTHGDLRDNMWVNEKETAGDGRDNDGNGYVDDYYGVDIVAGRGNGMDDHGHGTHVAGVIAAVNNLQGTVGVAFNTKIMSVKAGMSSGYFTQDAIAKAILYAYENGADVINMSAARPAPSPCRTPWPRPIPAASWWPAPATTARPTRAFSRCPTTPPPTPTFWAS